VSRLVVMSKPYAGASTSLADFKQFTLLGEGAYSVVYRVLRLADQGLYALKKVKLPSLTDKEKLNALNEIRLLASVRHENVIDYKEAFFDDNSRCLCIVTEYADAGDLYQLITKCHKERAHLREADVWRYLFGMCRGLKTLHELKILHRDLKCANVFLSASREGPAAKLGDFNVSKVAKRGLCMTQTGTPYYASPEVWRDMPYDAKSDMWSLGCVLYEMLALRPPFRADDMEGLYRKVLRGQYPRIPHHYSNDLSEVVSLLLQVNPRHRPSVHELLEMPLMRKHAPEEGPEGDNKPMDLLQTIKLPKNAIDLSLCLPKSRYDVQNTGPLDISDPAPAVERRQVSRHCSQGPSMSDPPVPRLPLGEHRRGSQVGLESAANHEHMVQVPDSLDTYLLEKQRPSNPPSGRQCGDVAGFEFDVKDVADAGRLPKMDGLGDFDNPRHPERHSRPREHRESRDHRRMANYAKHALSAAAQKGVPSVTETNPSSVGLRLPRIFPKAS